MPVNPDRGHFARVLWSTKLQRSPHTVFETPSIYRLPMLKWEKTRRMWSRRLTHSNHLPLSFEPSRHLLWGTKQTLPKARQPIVAYKGEGWKTTAAFSLLEKPAKGSTIARSYVEILSLNWEAQTGKAETKSSLRCATKGGRFCTSASVRSERDHKTNVFAHFPLVVLWSFRLLQAHVWAHPSQRLRSFSGLMLCLVRTKGNSSGTSGPRPKTRKHRPTTKLDVRWRSLLSKWSLSIQMLKEIGLFDIQNSRALRLPSERLVWFHSKLQWRLIENQRYLSSQPLKNLKHWSLSIYWRKRYSPMTQCLFFSIFFTYLVNLQFHYNPSLLTTQIHMWV